MCDPVTIGLAGLALSAGGTIMNASQQRQQMKRYNNQVSSQNALLSQQYADRTQKINAARDEQARTANEMSAQQDAEFQKQKQMADQKANLFQQAVQDPAVLGANSPAFQQGVDTRNKLFQDSALPADYSTGGPTSAGGTENRVVQAASAKIAGQKKQEVSGIADAAARMGAQQDAGVAQNQLFRDIGLKLNDAGDAAQTSERMLESRMRLPQYHMTAVGNAAGDQAQQPYFSGQDPQYKPPNTMFADVFSGLGNLGANYMFRQPQQIAYNDINWNSPRAM